MASDVITTPPQSWVDTPPNNPPIRKASASLLTHMPWLDKLSNPLQRGILWFFG